MCGIAGLYNPRQPVSADLVRQMTDVIAHRGPDDSGLQALEGGRLVLGQRRLAILDLSPSGHQPMMSADGAYCIVFNGEVYNFRQLRRELEPLGHRFGSESDTEVVVAAYRQWGNESFKRFRGMFALALWDRERRRLVLARDRFAVKPLYYSVGAQGLAFGSELRTLLVSGAAGRQVSDEALAEYLRFGYVSAPRCILAGVNAVRPGQVIEFDEQLCEHSAEYWSTTAELRNGAASELARELATLPEEALLDRAEAVLTEAFGLRLVSDVPVGLFLSGGIDSSLVATILARNCGAPLRTFTIGYADSEFDESGYARQVATTLGTPHTERIVAPDDALTLCDRIPEVFDEPMADASCLPTLMVCELAREQVKVALSADGADELFGGYARYRVVGRFLERRRQWGGTLFGLGADALGLVPAQWLAAAYRWRAGGGPRYAAIGDKLRKFRAMAKADSESAAYAEAVSEWGATLSQQLLRRPTAPDALAPRDWAALPAADVREQMMHFDALRYLPGDLLTKVDRTSMSVALEAREPFLDQEIVRFAAALPMSWRIRGDSGKYLLRRLLARHFPAEFFNRPKQGFSPPLGAWLRGPLRAALCDRLSAGAVRRVGLLDAAQVQRTLDEFLKGRATVSAAGIWALFQLQCWADRWLRVGG